MVVGIGEILTFNRKCTIFVGLLLAVIFITLIMVPSQAEDDDLINKVSNQIVVDAVYPENTSGAQSDTYFDKVNQLLTVWHVNGGGVLNIELLSSQDLTSPVITDFKVEPNTSVSVNNPAIASAYVEDENPFYIDFEFVDLNNLMDTNTMLLWYHTNYSGINDTYFSPPWYANAWTITNGTVDDIVTTVTDADWPDNIIILGNFTQNATSEEEEALLWFNISTGNLHNVTRDDIVLTPLTIESGVSTFKVFNIKYDIAEYFEEGPTYTLYTIENANNPYLVSTHVSTGIYEVGVFAEDNNSYYYSDWIEVEVDNTPPEVDITEPENFEIDVDIDTNITATFSEPMNSPTLNNSTVKVYIQEKIAGETFEDTVGTWNSTNFQGFTYTEQLGISPQLIDGSHRTIGEDYITYSTQPLLKDYLIYANEGIEVKGSGNYSVMGWLGDEYVVINNWDWILSDLVFEQNSTDTKTLHVGETWDLGDGYSLKLREIDVDGNEAWMALNNSNGEILDRVFKNQSAGTFTTDLDLADDVTLLVTYLEKVNTTQIELKYTWLISQDLIEINTGSGPGIFKTTIAYDTVYLRNDEDVLLTRGNTIPLFDDFKFEVEDTSAVRYRLVHQTETPVEGDISYSSSSNTVTFDPVLNLNEHTDYFSLITTGAEDLGGNGLTEDYLWTFRTVDATPLKITDLNIVFTSSTASITWNTIGVPSNSTVKYNESGNLTILEKIDTEYVESHAIHLDFLEANTTYYYYIISADQAGNTNESSINNFTTLTVPVVTIHSPPSITNDSTPLLNATFDRIVTSAWSVLDGAAGIGWYNTDHLITTLPELSDGQHRVVVDAIDYEGDYMGNIGTAIQDFIVDSTLPTATAYIVYEKGTAANNDSTIILNVSANDNLNGSGIKSITANVSALNATEVIALSKTGNYWISNIVVSATDGNYSVNITVMDNASNVNYTQVNVTMDNIPPGVEKVNAVPNLMNLSGTVNLTARICASGDNDSYNDIENVSAEITYPNGSNIIYQMNTTISTSILSMGSIGGGGFGCTEYHLDFGNTIDPGRYNVKIIANDTTGNVNDTQKTSFIVAHIYNTGIITTNASNSTFINAPGTNVTLELFTNDSITGSINITRSIVNITNELDVSGPGIYVRINASTNFSDNNNSNLSWALIKVNYTDEDVNNNNLVESSLRLYWYNKSSGNWIKLETNSPTWVYGSGVNTAKNYVWANVSHFSDYGVGGELKEETQPTGNGDGDGGGGGVGGGGASGELYENIACSETDRQHVYQNSDISYRFYLDCNIVQYVNFTGLTNAGRITTKVEILNDTSTLVDNPPSDIVYKNLNIWIGNAGWATKRNIADATVVFTVEKSWITADNIDESSIALYRYSYDTWHELVTRKISEDVNSLQFEAETPGFSPFAVTGKTIGESGGEGIVEPTVTAEKTPAPTPTEKKGIPGFSLFEGVSVLLIVVQLLRKKE